MHAPATDVTEHIAFDDATAAWRRPTLAPSLAIDSNAQQQCQDAGPVLQQMVDATNLRSLAQAMCEAWKAAHTPGSGAADSARAMADVVAAFLQRHVGQAVTASRHQNSLLVGTANGDELMLRADGSHIEIERMRCGVLACYFGSEAVALHRLAAEPRALAETPHVVGTIAGRLDQHEADVPRLSLEAHSPYPIPAYTIPRPTYVRSPDPARSRLYFE